MKLFRIKNIDGFFEVVNKCKGTVELISPEGDRINLKSRLAQYFAIANIFGDTELTKDVEIVCHDPEDVILMMKYMMQEEA